MQASGAFEFIPAPLASPETIELVHDPEYVRGFLGGTLANASCAGSGFRGPRGWYCAPWRRWDRRMLRLTSASMYGWGGGLAGGTHHAFRDEGSGFCVFNDIAVAIEALRSERRIRRAAILDLDVHQGDGTAKIFERDPDVLTISVHGRNNFPFRKQTGRVDIALADGTGDDEFLRVVEDVTASAFAFRPDIVFFQSGVDGLASDVLGRLKLTHAGLRARDHIVFSACKGRMCLASSPSEADTRTRSS